MIYDMVQYGHRRRPGHGDDPDRVICEIVESPPVSAPTVQAAVQAAVAAALQQQQQQHQTGT